MKVLYSLGLREKHKNMFTDYSIDDVISNIELEEYSEIKELLIFAKESEFNNLTLNNYLQSLMIFGGGKKYPHISISWQTNWNELSTFFKYPQAIKTLIYTTNPIESLNSTIKRKTKTKGSFPIIDSAFKMLYLSTQEVQDKWEKTRMRNWSEIYPQLCIFFSEIMEKYTK